MDYKNPYAEQVADQPTAQPSNTPEGSLDNDQGSPELITSARRYYKNLDNKIFKDDKEVMDYYINDRRWKDSNVLSTLKELNYVKGGWGQQYASDTDLQDLSVMRKSWEARPNMFQDIGQGKFGDATEAFVSNIAKGALDPTVLLGGMFGKLASKGISMAAGKAVSAGVDAAVKVGTGIATDAAITAGADVADQNVRIGLHQQEDVDAWEAIKAGGVGALLSAPGHVLANRKIDKGGLVKDANKAAEQAISGAAILEKKGFSKETGLLDEAKNVNLEGAKINRDEAAQQLGPELIVDTPKLEPVTLTTFNPSANEGLVKWAVQDGKAYEYKQKSTGGWVINKELTEEQLKQSNLHDKFVEARDAQASQAAKQAPELIDKSFLELSGGDQTNIVDPNDEEFKSSRYLRNLFPNLKSLYGAKFGETYSKVKGRMDKFAQDQFFITSQPEDFERMLGDAVANVKDELGNDREALLQGRGIVTDRLAQRRATSQLKGQTLEEATGSMTDTPKGFVDTVEGSYARQIVLQKLDNEFSRLANHVNSTEAGKLSDEDLKRWDWIQSAYPAAQLAFANMKEEAGRTLRSFSNRYAPTTMQDVFKKTGKMIDPITNEPVTRDAWINTQKDIALAASKLDKGNALQLDLFLHNLQGAGTVDKMKEVWYNSLLSSPSTHIINAMGNFTVGVVKGIENSFANATNDLNTGSMAWRVAGYMNSWQEAWKTGLKVFQTEIPSDPRTRLEMARGQAVPSYIWDSEGEGFNRFRQAGLGEGGIGGRQIRLPGRILMATDEFAKMIHYRASLRDTAVLRINAEAKAKGVTLATEDLQKAVDESMANPMSVDMDTAREYARKMTFTDDPGHLAQLLGKAVDAVQVGGIPVGRLVVPFVRTPTNIVRFAGDMIGLTAKTREDIAAGGYRRSQAQARLLMGYSLVGGAIGMSAGGLVTGASPQDPQERQTFEAEGKLPWSVKVGSQWVQWNRLDPVAIPFALGAGVPELMKAMIDPTRQDAFLSTAAGLLSDAFLDKTWFQGVQNAMEAITSPERKLQSFGNGIVRTFVPSIVAGMARAYDPRVTAPQTLMEVIQDRLGFEARTKVPQKYDALGFPVISEVAGSGPQDRGVADAINRFVNPFKAKTDDGDIVKHEIDNLRVKLPIAKKTWNGLDLDSGQFSVLSRATGEYTYNALKFAMSNPQWGSLNPTQKRVAIDAVTRESGKAGSLMLIATYPELLALAKSPDHNSTLKRWFGPTNDELNDNMLHPRFKR